MLITYTACNFDGLFNVGAGTGLTQPGISLALGSGHSVLGGAVRKFKVGVASSNLSNTVAGVSFSLNEKDVTTPDTFSQTIVRDCGPAVNSTVVQRNVALSGLIRGMEAGYGAFNNAPNTTTDPTSIGNDDTVIAVTVANRGFASIPAFPYVGYPGTNLLVRIRAKAVSGNSSLQSFLSSDGTVISTQSAQTVPAGSWAWYTFTIPLAQIVDNAKCGITLRSSTTVAGTLLVDAMKLDVS